MFQLTCFEAKQSFVSRRVLHFCEIQNHQNQQRPGLRSGLQWGELTALPRHHSGDGGLALAAILPKNSTPARPFSFGPRPLVPILNTDRIVNLSTSKILFKMSCLLLCYDCTGTSVCRPLCSLYQSLQSDASQLHVRECSD